MGDQGSTRVLRTARLAGVFYALNIVTGASALALRGGVATAVLLVAAACYVAVTLLFYQLFRPVNLGVSLVAAAVSLLGGVVGVLRELQLVPAALSPLPYFGVYCILIGYLIARSKFLPRVLGLFLALGGIGWLTFAWPALSRSLIPYNMAPGILAETALTLWLLARGVDTAGWLAQNRAGAAA